MICPKCHSDTLVTREVDDFSFTLEECSQCKGLWFDRGELETVLDVLAEPKLKIPGEAETPPRLCPHCKRLMYSFNYPDTYAKVEMCKYCSGIWLDAKELEQIIAVRQYRLAHPREPEKEAVPEQESGGGFKAAMISMIDSAIASLKL